MFLKVIVYGYLNNLYSDRQMEKLLVPFVKFTWKSDIEYMPCAGVSISRCDKIGSPGNMMPVVATPDGDAVSR